MMIALLLATSQAENPPQSVPVRPLLDRGERLVPISFCETTLENVMRGSCLCGNVQFQMNGRPRSVVACHCNQCRKTSGHYVAATQVATEDLEITGRESITWFQSSATATRGFCTNCGSQLFWTEPASGFTSVMAGTIDGKTELKLDRQLFPALKGDYYPLPEVDVVDQSTLRKGAIGAK